MLLTAYQLSLEMRATTVAADPNCTAVALAEQSAAKVSFQRFAPNFPPDKNPNSALLTERSAVQFSGKSAKLVQFVQNLHLDTQK